jgi:alpha-tubulin suppressor-like RCC1 family protein
MSSAAYISLPVTNRAVDISAHSATCVLLEGGQGYCWGANSDGQVGTGGSATAVFVPNPVNPPASPIVQLIAGYTSCALKGNGAIVCWGNNAYGSIGIGSTSAPKSFTASLDISFSDTLPAVYINGAAAYTICAIFSNGKLRCWGNNGHYDNSASFGQLGQGHTRRFVGRDASDMSSIPYISFFEGTATVTSVSQGYFITCALFQTPGIRCWGWGALGSLGYNATNNIGLSLTDMSSLPFISFGTTHQPVQVACGMQTCARFSNGGLRCWGANNGLLGIGSTANYISPISSLGFIAFSDSLPAVDLSVDSINGHSCALFSNQRIRCKAT